MAVDYSHTFHISVGDGGKFLVGEFTPDPDPKKAKQKIDESPDPLPLEFFEDAISLIKQVTELFNKYGGIKKIQFQEKQE